MGGGEELCVYVYLVLLILAWLFEFAISKVLATLVTSPDAGQALADIHHLSAYVETTPGGLDLYQICGSAMLNEHFANFS